MMRLCGCIFQNGGSSWVIRYIYVCQSGLYQNATDRENKLYINQGDLTFTEEAKKYGLNDPGFSIQAYFFDYDRDSDLDMFLINHRHDFENNNLITPRDQIKYDEFSSYQLYQNNGNGTFSRVTQKSGIINYISIKLAGPEINRFGIGAIVSINYGK